MEQCTEFVDLLLARRKDCDILWVSRSMNPLSPHKLPPESKYSRNEMIQMVLNDEKVKSTIISLAAMYQTDIKNIIKEAHKIINEMASKAHLTTVRWIGLLSTILESLLEGSVPDIYFVPISINYERPPEELLFAYELLGIPKPKESTAGLLQSLSILQKSYAYGCIVCNIGEPISACQFLSMEHRKAKVLSPYAKLPTSVIKKLAYCIIDSHKKNTILMPFNLVALLFNERSQTYPDNPYTLNDLVSDYLWCTNFLQVFNATIHTRKSFDRHDQNVNNVKQEILDSLKPHEELLVFDASKILRLKERHRTTKLKSNIRVKGHTLLERTMRVAIPVINISIYLNPTLSFLIKPAVVTVAIGIGQIELGIAFKRYMLLRMLLSTEFAMPLTENESVIKSEWEETLNLLLKQDYISIHSNTYVQSKDTKWDETKLNYITIQAVLIETQKQIEKAFLEESQWGQHPYSLSIDLVNTTICNLITQGILIPYEKQHKYQVDKVKMTQILTQLQSLSLKRPLDLFLLPRSNVAPVVVDVELFIFLNKS
ncbi:Dihydroxyacetone phosphate acyltransferase [Eufriesea mexicana]|uniref:Dihydroxyacetone phosphate acyltransferase n=1 Tax=Eufriesea mexicana TaxID=516756 RepID=A0A310SMA4_9HYME|nr:Dihydroxyacetone phosphate acyltransferase [Eufriesea mexicana]